MIIDEGNSARQPFAAPDAPVRAVVVGVIRHLDGHQRQLINRMRWGQMIIPGQTLYVLEVEPAAYAALAANEAEKAAEIRILEVRAFGSLGRVYAAAFSKSVG